MRAWVTRPAPEHQLLVPSMRQPSSSHRPRTSRPGRRPTAPTAGPGGPAVPQLRGDGDSVGVRFDQAAQDEVALRFRAQQIESAPV